MKFTRIPIDTFETLQVNAGILVDDFDLETGTYDEADFLSATSGGIKIDITNEYEDFGEDIDNAPKDTAELKRIKSTSVKLTTSFLAVSEKAVKFLLGAADKDAETGAIKPRKDLKMSDFGTKWFLGDMADNGFVAIKVSNALSTGGLSLQTSDKGKGKIGAEITGHTSLEEQDVVPVEIYISEDPELIGKISLNKNSISIPDGDTFTLIPTVYPAGTSVTWSSSDTTVATVANGVVTAEAEGVCVIIAKITVSGESFIASCDVTVTEAESEG